MSSKKQNDTQKLLQSIYVKNKCKSMDEAWKIYRQMYEDVELEPNTYQSKPIPQRGKD